MTCTVGAAAFGPAGGRHASSARSPTAVLRAGTEGRLETRSPFQSTGSAAVSRKDEAPSSGRTRYGPGATPQ